VFENSHLEEALDFIFEQSHARHSDDEVPTEFFATGGGSIKVWDFTKNEKMANENSEKRKMIKKLKGKKRKNIQKEEMKNNFFCSILKMKNRKKIEKDKNEKIEKSENKKATK